MTIKGNIIYCILFLFPAILAGQNNKLVLKGHTDLVTTVCFSPNGSLIGSAGDDDKLAKIWDAKTGKELQSLEFTSPQIACTFTTDGKTFITGGNDGKISFFETTEWKLKKEYSLPTTEAIWHIDVAPDGKTIAIASWDFNVYLLELATFKLSTLVGHTQAVCSVAYSSGGRYLASASNDRTIILWDTQELILKKVYTGHTNDASTVAFSPDGSKIISGSDDHQAIIWETGLASGSESETGGLLKTILMNDEVRAVAWSPNGKYFAVSGTTKDANIYIYNSITYREVAVLPYHTSYVNDLNFNPSGTLLVSCSSDHDVVIWNLDSFGVK